MPSNQSPGLFKGLGGIFGYLASGDERDKAAQYEQQAFDVINGLKVPKLAQFDPALQQASGMNAIQMDPRSRAAQLQALEGFRQATLGPTLADRANASLLRDQAANAQQATQAGIMRQAANSGVNGLGGGAALTARMRANAANYGAAGQQASTLTRDAALRAMDAYREMASTGSNIGNEDFQRQAAIAAANDRINNFNTGVRNAAQQYNLGLPQQDFENQTRLGGLRSGAMRGQADYWRGRAKDAVDLGASIGGVADAGLDYVNPFKMPRE